MNNFIPRLNANGIYNNPYWYSSNPLYKIGYGLPNCTCYAWGRFCEIQGKIDPNIPTRDAGLWFGLAQGKYRTGVTPEVGAIACWSKSGGAGHVAIVEQVNADGSYVVSQSGYHRPIASYPPDTKNYFWTNIISGKTNLAPWMKSYSFQGFIYCPSISPVPPEPPIIKSQGYKYGGYLKWIMGMKYNGL